MHRIASTRRFVVLGCMLVLICIVGLSSASATANVLMMPNTDVVTGDTVVVWGNTKFANGSPFTIDFGDGSPILNGVVADQSYIATTHIYTAALNGTIYTASLTVGGETETAQVRVFVPAQTTAENIRSVNVRKAIRDGLRFLYFNQDNRAATFNTPITSWGPAFNLAYQMSNTALAVLAYENHGFLVNNNPNKDIYQAVVQRGLNFTFDQLGIVNLTLEPAGDPCVGLDSGGNPIGPAPCQGLAQNFVFPTGYSTSIAALATAGAVAGGAGGSVVAAGLGANNGGFVAGKTYAEILQRQINTIAWAQADSGFNQGGWRYGLDDNDSDGSAIGWAVLAILDGQAAGAAVPAFVPTELAVVIANTSCPQPAADLTNGLSYAGCGRGNVLRTGVALQALSLMGVPNVDPRVVAATNYINTAWNNFHPNGEDFSCVNPSGLAAGSPSGSGNNKGCIYAMFQVFKGLLLNAVTTLPNAQPLSPGAPPGASNWKREYEDYLVANQQNPATTMGGQWTQPQVQWSCCEAGGNVLAATTALAELILSATPIVLPSQIVLEPETDVNQLPDEPVHTVTATVLDANGNPLPGVQVTFEVISGPHAGEMGQGITDANGQATFTYTAKPCPDGAGTDEIQASVGVIESNVVTKEWVCEIEVPVDIKPTSCPNPINCKSQGLLPAAILGTAELDVTQIDPSTVTLQGVSPVRWALEDVATPFVPFTGKEDCEDCTTEGPDGFTDLTLKFDTQAVVAAIGDVPDKTCVLLTLTGNLKAEFGGTAIVGEDVVRFQCKGGKK